MEMEPEMGLKKNSETNFLGANYSGSFNDMSRKRKPHNNPRPAHLSFIGSGRKIAIRTAVHLAKLCGPGRSQ
jgi:hypothetical protein